MFRHTFATNLLDADVDIRFIQEMLGNSSINKYYGNLYTCNVCKAKKYSEYKTSTERFSYLILRAIRVKYLGIALFLIIYG